MKLYDDKHIKTVAFVGAHHSGKTTLAETMLFEAGLLNRRGSVEEKNTVSDFHELEKERQTSIFATPLHTEWRNYKINIIDTPGHADFGGEVERVLNMADGVLLLVDAFEGAMPQTRFVLQKALAMGKKPIVVINKVDKPNCRPDEVHDQVFELFFNLDATEEQLDFPTVYGSSKQGWMGPDYKTPTSDITYLLDMIIEHIPTPKIDVGSLQVMISSLDYSSFIGRIAIGRVKRGAVKVNQPVSLVKRDGSILKSRVKELFTFEGLGKIKVEEVVAGDICGVFGIENFEIGDTIAEFENPEGMVPIQVDEPTMCM